MKKLVIFYSRTGNTKRIAEEIARKINADIDEVTDLKKRKGILNWILAGRDGMKRNLTKIRYSKDPGKYDLIIVGTPVWVNMTPAIRTYLLENKNKIKKIAFFLTSGGDNKGKTFYEMEKISKKPVAVFSLREKKIKESHYANELNEFCSRLK